MKTRSIQIQGKGNVSQAPDRLRINFTISHREMEFLEAVEGCNQRIDAIRSAISEVGLRESDLKTTSFSINAAHEYRKNVNVHVGFDAVHQVAFELQIDKPLIGRLLSAIIHGTGKPRMNLMFTVSDPESLKQKVLADAVANAQRRADTIAQAASLKLGAIERIEYGYSEIRVSSDVYEMEFESLGKSVASAAPDIEPNDIRSEDTVTIVWELET